MRAIRVGTDLPTRLRVYAAPFLDEQAGVEVVSSEVRKSQVFECLNYCCKQRIDQSAAAAVITSLIQQSQDMYLRQAMREPFSVVDDCDAIARVQCFKETLEGFPGNAQGYQVLICATYLAALDCLLEEHKRFFKEALLLHHRRSGFNNILKGVEQLEMLWAKRSYGEKWTSLLPQQRLFVM